MHCNVQSLLMHGISSTYQLVYTCTHRWLVLVLQKLWC